MSKQTKKGYKNALRIQLSKIKCVDSVDFPEEGIITFSYNIETGEIASTINPLNSQSAPGDGGTGGEFP